jgi:hypothetical protein
MKPSLDHRENTGVRMAANPAKNENKKKIKNGHCSFRAPVVY